MQILGLSAERVKQNRVKYGENRVPGVRLKTWWDFFLEICSDKVNMILLVMLGLLIGVAWLGYGSWTESIGVGGVLCIVYIIGIFTKLKAQKNTSELFRRSAIRFCNVIRDGKFKHINVNDVVVEDIVVLQSGETIPADGYLIYGEIAVNNAILNGESEDCLKHTVKNYKYDFKKLVNADDYTSKNLLFAGTSVRSGEGYMQVTRVGVNTENAKTLLSMRHVTETKTGLNIKLDHFASMVSVLGYIAATIFFVLTMSIQIHNIGGFYNFYHQDTLVILHNVLVNFTLALTIVISIVPEGLPLIINIITAQNAKKMLKHGILAKNTNKISEAGNIQILCTDKTGTLTYGKLTPITNYLGNGTQIGFDSETPLGEMITTDIVLNTEAMHDDNNAIIGGTFTQRALLETIDTDSQLYKSVIKNVVVNKVAFNSANKFGIANIKMKKYDNKTFAFYAGAPEIILAHTSKYMDIDGKKHEIDSVKMHRLLHANAKQAKRLMALAYHETKNIDGKIQNDLILLSLIAIRDDVRDEVPAAVKRMQTAGIQVVMITGDNIDTAIAIARDSGIITNADDIAITAHELEQLSDAQISDMIDNIRVIARATPTTKLRIVQVAQKKHLCIGMCGDGTNDAPALRQADVGFAMGSGTDVCKEAGDIIITDDNFVSVTNTVLFGRTFMENVNKFLSFQLPINISMMLICLLCPIFYNDTALTAVQILIINIVTDSLNSLAFGGEPTKAEYMHVAPKSKNAPLITEMILNKAVLDVSVFLFLMILASTMWFQHLFNVEAGQAMSYRFALLTIVAIVNGFAIRENGFNLFKGLSKNLLFIFVALIVISFTVLVTQFGGEFLGATPLSISQWVIIFVLSLVIIPLDMIRKNLLHKVNI